MSPVERRELHVSRKDAEGRRRKGVVAAWRHSPSRRAGFSRRREEREEKTGASGEAGGMVRAQTSRFAFLFEIFHCRFFIFHSITNSFFLPHRPAAATFFLSGMDAPQTNWKGNKTRKPPPAPNPVGEWSESGSYADPHNTPS